MTLRAGAASVDITPPVGTRLAGQFQDRLMEDVHDPLSARALVLDDGRGAVAVVSCDLLSLKRPTVLAARAAVAQHTPIPAQNVLICATHTHDGPQVVDLFTRPPDADCLAMLPRQIASAVALAYRRLQPVAVGIASGYEEHASYNRRFLLADGSIRMHAPTDLPHVVGPEGPNDPEVGVLWARAMDGQVVAAVISYTAHATAVGNERAASADYPGYVVAAMRRWLGPQSTVLFVNGAFGNVGPVGRYSPDRREYGYHWAERTGLLIGAEAAKVVTLGGERSELRLRTASETLALPTRAVSEGQLASARTALDRDGALPPVEQIYAGELLLLAEERRRAAAVSAEVQVIALGDAALVGMPGELFVEFGLELKQRSPFRSTYIAGMANGCVGYIPTRRAFANGGYETRLARSSKLVPEAGEQLTEAALRLLARAHAEG